MCVADWRPMFPSYHDWHLVLGSPFLSTRAWDEEADPSLFLISINRTILGKPSEWPSITHSNVPASGSAFPSNGRLRGKGDDDCEGDGVCQPLADRLVVHDEDEDEDEENADPPTRGDRESCS